MKEKVRTTNAWFDDTFAPVDYSVLKAISTVR